MYNVIITEIALTISTISAKNLLNVVLRPGFARTR